LKKLLTILLFTILYFGYSQTAQTNFGKNRVQFKQLDWKVITTKNFNVYYYIGGNNLAFNAARHLETNFNNITHAVGYLPYDKINVLIYNCDADYQQSNISLENTVAAGGQTNLVSSKIEVAFQGTQTEFFNQLDKKMAQLFIDIIIYGGSLKDNFQSSYLIDFPNWFLGGCSQYIGYGDTEEMYNAVQDFLSSKKKNPDRLTGTHATLIGQSIFHFIEKKYGKYAIANVLALTKATRNEETGIRGSVGLNYETFLAEWRNYYTELFSKNKIKKEEIYEKSKNSSIITQLKLSPDKNKIAYAINRKGIYFVYIKNLETNKKELIYYGGIKNIHWLSNPNIPLIAWKSNEELCLIKYKEGKPYLLTKNIRKKLMPEKKLFVTFEAILSFNFSTFEDEMVLSGVKDGQIDIYTYDTKNDVAKQITKDLYDDLYPSFSPDGQRIIFTSNRLSDTLRGDFGDYSKIKYDYNLFEFDGTRTLKRITNSPTVNESMAYYWSNSRILFLASDGVQNQLYTLTTGDKIAQKIISDERNIHQFLAKEGNIFTLNRYKNKDLIVHKQFEKFQLNSEQNYIALNESSKNPSDSSFSNEVLINYLESFDPFDIGYESDPKQVTIKKNETFENNSVKISSPTDPTPYFIVDYFISSVQIDPIRNLGGLFEVGGSDLFSNHKFQGKIYTNVNMKSHDMFFQYEYLKHKYDLRIRLNKNSYLRSDDFGSETQRQTKIDFLGTISKPFSPVARLEYQTGLSRTSFVDFFNILGSIEYNSYHKNSLQFVYDNTNEKLVNQLHGFRLKAGVEKYSLINGSVSGFNKIFVDARNYQDLFRDIVWATRISYGKYGGKFPRQFVLGGMDNWFFQKYENNSQFDPYYLGDKTENPYLLFNDFTTNMRGFGYNKMNGNSHFLFNSELRIPIIRALYSGPINSSFYRNLQLNLFYEIGSAWNGKYPFNQDNSINTHVFGNSATPYSGTVTNYQNPFISSYGFGFRSILFGYYLKLDFAWGVQNFVRLKPKAYLTLGYDF
jgi:hypothetical protein